MTGKRLVEEKRADSRIALYGGLAGICMVAVIQFLSLPTLDRPLMFALLAFSLAIPALVLSAVIGLLVKVKGFTVESSKLEEAFDAIGMFSAILGLVAVFAHFNTIVAAVFFVASLLAGRIFVAYGRTIERAEREMSAGALTPEPSIESAVLTALPPRIPHTADAVSVPSPAQEQALAPPHDGKAQPDAPIDADRPETVPRL
jgi:hypothetical protein